MEPNGLADGLMGVAGERPGPDGFIGDGFEDATVSDERLRDKEDDRLMCSLPGPGIPGPALSDCCC
jgi:hypothetical protein